MEPRHRHWRFKSKTSTKLGCRSRADIEWVTHKQSPPDWKNFSEANWCLRVDQSNPWNTSEREARLAMTTKRFALTHRTRQKQLLRQLPPDCSQTLMGRAVSIVGSRSALSSVNGSAFFALSGASHCGWHRWLPWTNTCHLCSVRASSRSWLCARANTWPNLNHSNPTEVYRI